MPQGLHQDQPPSGDGFQTPEAPMQISAMVMISDVNAANGGTLLVPGSHRILSEAGNRGAVEWLPPAINCTAPAGTCLIFDARVLHGTGVNTTDEPRYVMNAGFMCGYMRQQDNYCLGLRADVLARASDEALRRMGFQAVGALGTVDGHGFGSSAKTGDPKAQVKSECTTILPVLASSQCATS